MTFDLSEPESQALQGCIPPDGPILQPYPKRALAVRNPALRLYPEAERPKAGGPRRDRSKGENGDHFPGVVFRVPGTNYRVAADPAGYCWLLQRRRAKDHWLSVKFFSNKRRLAVVLKELVSPETFKEVETKIAELPI